MVSARQEGKCPPKGPEPVGFERTQNGAYVVTAITIRSALNTHGIRCHSTTRIPTRGLIYIRTYVFLLVVIDGPGWILVLLQLPLFRVYSRARRLNSVNVLAIASVYSFNALSLR